MKRTRSKQQPPQKRSRLVPGSHRVRRVEKIGDFVYRHLKERGFSIFTGSVYQHALAGCVSEAQYVCFRRTWLGWRWQVSKEYRKHFASQKEFKQKFIVGKMYLRLLGKRRARSLPGSWEGVYSSPLDSVLEGIAEKHGVLDDWSWIDDYDDNDGYC